jgi:hypothetical protein
MLIEIERKTRGFFYDAFAFWRICFGVRSNESMRVALISLRLSLCDAIAPSMVSNLAAIFASLNNSNSIIEETVS